MDREFSLLLPKSDGGNEDLKTNTSFLLIGANGAGKTRLGTWIEMTSPQKEKVHRISAQKSLSMPDTTISVGAVDYDFTYIYLRCCGRFTANDERLYYKQFDRGPFGIKSPAIPPHIELGDHETKFWIGDAVQPPKHG